MEPLVSIVTPTYNHEKFIGQCIESVLSQTFPKWEQIIIDDGSTDGTSEIIAQYKDKRIRYVWQENMGIWRLGKIYNKALGFAQGELIAILEGDDFWPPNKLEKQIPTFHDSEVVLNWGRGSYVNEEGKLIGEIKIFNFKSPLYQNKPKGIALRKLLSVNYIVPSSTVMIRKQPLLFIGGFKQPSSVPCVDYPTWLELALQGEFSFIDEILGYWRKHSSQVTVNLSKEGWLLGRSQTVAEFCDNLSAELKKRLGINDKLIKARNRWFKGRAELIDKQWRGAREEFVQAISKGSFPTRLKSVIGLIASYLKMDIERFCKMKCFRPYGTRKET